MNKRMLFLAVNLLFASLILAADWTVETVPNTHTVNAAVFSADPDQLLDDANQSKIDQILFDLEKQTTAEVFVVALKSIGEADMRMFATDLFQRFGLGKKSKDNGLLVLFVEDQRKVTMEVGYGLEGVLPDVVCFRIIDEIMVPIMKQGQYGLGMLNGVQRVVRILSDPNVLAEISVDKKVLMQEKRAQKINRIKWMAGGYLFLSVLVLILLLMSGQRKFRETKNMPPYDAYKHLKTMIFGLKFLSVLFPLTILPLLLYYKKKLDAIRKAPRNCAICSRPMLLMNEKQEDAYLNIGQQNEERVGSVDYDVWVCMDCGNKSLLPYDQSFTRYKKCPHCQYKTFAQISDRIVSPPTPLSTGQGQHVFSCANCGHEAVKYFVIPMIVVLPTGNGRGNGGFGGGGFGGGSFGGGSSGGGGASGGW